MNYHGNRGAVVFDCDNVLKLYTPANLVVPLDREAVQGMEILRGRGFGLHLIASGKPVDYLLAVTRETARQYGLDNGFFDGLHLIGENGAVVAHMHDGTLKEMFVAPQDGYRELAQALGDYGWQELRKAVEQGSTANGTWMQFQLEGVPGNVTQEYKRAIRTLLFNPPSAVEPARRAIQSAIDRYNLPFRLHYATTSYGGYIDIIPKGIDKNTGLRFESEYNKVLPEQMRVIVDGENDLPMVEFAGPGSRAVGNATPEVKTAVIDRGGFVAKGEVGAGVLEIARHEKALFS